MSDFKVYHTLLRDKLKFGGLKSKITYNPDKPWEFIKRLYKAVNKDADDSIGSNLDVELFKVLGYDGVEFLGSITHDKALGAVPANWVSNDEQLEWTVGLANAVSNLYGKTADVYKMDYLGKRTCEVYFYVSDEFKGINRGLSTYYSNAYAPFGKRAIKRFVCVGKADLVRAVMFSQVVSEISAKRYSEHQVHMYTRQLKVAHETSNYYMVDATNRAIKEASVPNTLTRFRHLVADYVLDKATSVNIKSLAKYFVEDFVRAYNEEMNISMMEHYNNTLSSDYAHSWETKKNIPQKYLDAMSSSLFLKNGFTYVEFDSDTDLEVMADVERQWEYIFGYLPRPKSDKLELRFRKLGKHGAAGLWFDGVSCIAVDIRQPSSMIHEYGHFLDYRTTETNLSLQPEFESILSRYQAYIDKVKIPRGSYYKTPTEVFARAFEVYFAHNMPAVTVAKTLDKLRRMDEGEYAWYFENYDKVKSYFDNLFENVYGVKLQADPSKVPQATTNRKVTTKKLYGGVKSHIKWELGRGFDEAQEVPEVLSNVTTWGSVVDLGMWGFAYLVCKTDKETWNSRASVVVLGAEQLSEKDFITGLGNIIKRGDNPLANVDSLFVGAVYSHKNVPIGVSSVKDYGLAQPKKFKVEDISGVTRMIERFVKNAEQYCMANREINDTMAKIRF